MMVADLPLAVEGEVSWAEFVGKTHCVLLFAREEWRSERGEGGDVEEKGVWVRVVVNGVVWEGGGRKKKKEKKGKKES